MSVLQIATEKDPEIQSRSCPHRNIYICIGDDEWSTIRFPNRQLDEKAIYKFLAIKFFIVKMTF